MQSVLYKRFISACCMGITVGEFSTVYTTCVSDIILLTCYSEFNYLSVVPIFLYILKIKPLSYAHCEIHTSQLWRLIYSYEFEILIVNAANHIWLTIYSPYSHDFDVFICITASVMQAHQLAIWTKYFQIQELPACTWVLSASCATEGERNNYMQKMSGILSNGFPAASGSSRSQGTPMHLHISRNPPAWANQWHGCDINVYVHDDIHSWQEVNFTGQCVHKSRFGHAFLHW